MDLKLLYKNHNLAKDTEAYEDNMGHLVMHLLPFKSCYAAVLDIYANVVNGVNSSDFLKGTSRNSAHI